MKRSIAKIKGMAYILWHAKHEIFHVLLGLMWAWMLRELWQEFNIRWIVTAIIGSLLPDADHLLYFVTYGKRDIYTKSIVTFIHKRQWRVLVTFIETGHKYNTNLTFHNVYVFAGLFVGCFVSYYFDWKFATVLCGAMVSHYLFDIVEDFVLLGKINPNWKRFGRPKRIYSRSLVRAKKS